ncbi:MAG: hypothetical protein R2712_08610 [Vicinamibacterales bacterium]
MHEVLQARPIQLHDRARRVRAHLHQGVAAGQHADLAIELSPAETGHEGLWRTGRDDVDLAALHEEERRVGLALVREHLAGGHRSRPAVCGNALAVRVGEHGKEPRRRLSGPAARFGRDADGRVRIWRRR